jgi:hypothetical protein
VSIDVERGGGVTFGLCLRDETFLRPDLITDSSINVQHRAVMQMEWCALKTYFIAMLSETA